MLVTAFLAITMPYGYKAIVFGYFIYNILKTQITSALHFFAINVVNTPHGHFLFALHKHSNNKYRTESIFTKWPIPF